MAVEPPPRASGPTFVDPELDARFRASGWVTVSGFERSELLRLWEAHLALVGDEAGITFDTIRADRRPVQWLTEATRPLWDRLLPGLLVDHRVVYSGFVVKHPGDASGMAVHDDQTFVDERRHRSLTAWIPLTDTGPEEDNGWLGVVPRSHLCAPGASGFGIADWWAPYGDLLLDHLVPVPTRAGDVVLWDSRLLHGSPPNRSGAVRPAILAVIVPRHVELVHVRGRGQQARRVFRVDDRFHRDRSLLDVRRQLPDLPVIADIVDPDPSVGPPEIARLCGIDHLPVPMTAGPEAGTSVPRLPSVNRDHDLAAAAAASCAAVLDVLDAAPDLRSAIAAAGAQGGVVSLDRHPELLAAVDTQREITAEIVVLQPGRREQGRIEDGSVDLVVDEATGRGGVAWADGAVPFELGLVVAPPPEAAVTWWNEGPDPVVVLRVSAR